MQRNKSITKRRIFIEDFIDKFNNVPQFDIREEFKASFSLNLKKNSQKLTPILKLANVEDAPIISDIYRTVYNECYPFKNFEDARHLKDLMKSNQYKWILFKTDSNEITGCLGFRLNFDVKRGYLFGFAIKKEFQKNFDSLKAWIASLLYIWRKYTFSIPVWTSEVRTYCNTPQFANVFVNLIPVGFMPKKDIFDGKRESEFLTLAISKRLLNHRNHSKIPQINRQVLKPFSYSQKMFKLEKFLVKNPKLKLNDETISKYYDILVVRTHKDKFKNKYVNYSIKNLNCSFEFVYSSTNKNIEKTRFNVSSLEELAIFLKKFVEFIKINDVKYSEILISAYNPHYQRLIYSHGFVPRGYIPFYRFNEQEGEFEDYILFNRSEGDVNKEIKNNLIKETKELLYMLNNEFLLDFTL